MLKDDFMGEEMTDKNGGFKITLTQKGFR